MKVAAAIILVSAGVVDGVTTTSPAEKVLYHLNQVQQELDAGGEELAQQLSAMMMMRSEEGIVGDIVKPVTKLAKCLVKCVTHSLTDDGYPIPKNATEPVTEPDPVELSPLVPLNNTSIMLDIVDLLRKPW